MRNFIQLDMPQRSPEWFAARCGRMTASCAADMLASIKSGEAAKRRDLRAKLVVERLTGAPQEDGFTSKDMERGTALEPDARLAYEAATGTMVTQVGFLSHTSLLAGGSPDGVIGDYEGIVEIKVPKSATHFSYIKANALPSEYVGQVTHLLWLTGAQWCDFVSFDPRFPSALQLLIVRVKRDEAQIASYQLALSLFLSEVERDLAELKQRMEPAA